MLRQISHLISPVLLLGGLLLSGPAEASPLEVTPSLSLRQEYNDNILYTVRHEQEDWITTFSPALDLARRTERDEGFLRVRLDGLLYGAHSELNAIEQLYAGRYRYQVDPRLGLAAEASYTSDTRPDRDFETTGLVQGTATRHLQHYGLSGDYALTERTGASLSYTFDRVEYDTTGFVDYRRHSAFFGLERQWTTRTRLSTNMGYSVFDYPGLTVENATWTVGGAYQLSEIFTAILDVGPRHTRSEFDNGATDDSSGVVGQARLAYHGLKSSASLTFNEEIGAAAGDTTGTVERTALVLQTDHRLTQEIRGGLSLGYYLNTADSEFSFQEVDEETYLVNPRLRYVFSPEVTVEAAYRYSVVHNNLADTTAERNMVWLKLLLQYPIEDI